MVYSAASAADTMTAKAEASFSGYSVGVSAEFSKTESSSSQSSGIYFDYFAKKVFNPDPSNLKEFGMSVCFAPAGPCQGVLWRAHTIVVFSPHSASSLATQVLAPPQHNGNVTNASTVDTLLRYL